MEYRELIPDINDREFPLNVGHWGGDGVWASTSPLGGSGLIEISLPVGTGYKTIHLLYPRIKLPRSGWIAFVFHHAHITSGHLWGGFWWVLKDGVYEIGPYSYHVDTSAPWLKITGYFQTPSDWNQSLGRLFFYLYEVNDGVQTYWFDNFSFHAYVVSKPQYLPLMGVG